MRPRLRMRGSKITPKNLEKELLAKAKRLAESPGILIPICQEPCKKCDFEGLLRKMENIARFKDEPEKLISLASWGDQLVRAYAATISLAAAGKIPYLAVINLPIGEVSYAIRGKVDKEKLIGVEYFDDPDLRLLAFWEIAKKRDLHMYSSSDRFTCSSEPRAPAEYVREMIDTAPYKIDRQEKCPHPDSNVALNVIWKSPKVTVSVCQECISDANLLHHFTSRIAARDPTDDFEIDVRYDLECRSNCTRCLVKEPYLMSSGLREEYFKGEIDDKTLVEKFVKEKLVGLKGSREVLFVAGSRCFGSDKNAFIEHIRGSEAEKAALSGLISSTKMSIISTTDQASRIISDLWEEHGERLLSQVASSTVVESLRRESSNMAPAQLIQEAGRLEMARGIHSSLPEYARLGEVGKYADRLARLFKTEGKSAVARLIEKERHREHRLRAVSYGFLIAVGESEGKAWQFTKEEMDFGSYLSTFASKLLQSDGDEYHDALQLIVQASGSIEEIARKP
ncbi:MAG: hypothetical protein LUQ55_00785 [Methanomassiliicoccales archaeon]|nr:hypothetical protein [Methanomassiliicoccales archaeon]